ncbi:MAG: GNAT family N-acetyltransferase [Blautia sp.]
MEIRYLKENEKQKTRILWEEAFFEDSDSFKDYYFSYKVKENQILAGEESDKIVSMIHRNPYMLTVGKKQEGNTRLWHSDYLVGVATALNRRGRGYMRRLLVQCLEDMYREEMPFCFLMPADERIYLPFDFTYIFRQPIWKLRQSSRLQKEKVTKEKYKDVACWMNGWLEERYEVFAYRDEKYVEGLVKELESEQGSLYVLKEQADTRWEMAGLYAEWGLKKSEQRLLYTTEEYGTLEKEKAAIMGRIVSLPRFVEAIRLKNQIETEEAVFYLEVQDQLLKKNEGPWLWHIDHQSSWLEPVLKKEKTGILCEIALSIQEMTAWLLGYAVPSSLCSRAKKMIRCLDGVFLDEIV